MGTYLVLLLSSVFTVCAYAKNPLEPFEFACRNAMPDAKMSRVDANKICSHLQKYLFKGSKPVQDVTPNKFGAPELPIDKKIRFIMLQEPHYLAAYTYCYNVFKAYIDFKSVPPEQNASKTWGLYVIGISEYSHWLKTDAGKACSKVVKKWTGMNAVDLLHELNHQRGLVILHPNIWMRIAHSEKAFKRLATVIINHERIHAIQFTCPQADAWAPGFWNSLKLEERKTIEKNCPRANWADPETAVSEGLGCYFQEQPTQILKYTGKCVW